MNDQPMGVGEKGRPDATFVRSFRWTLSASNRTEETTLPEHFQKSVKFDFARQLIYIESYEVVLSDADDIDIQSWLDNEDLNRDIITFNTYDGCGQELYEYNFHDLCVVGDDMSFDYATSKESVRKVIVKFGEYERRYKANGNDKLVKPLKKYIYKISIDGSKEVNVTIHDRPSVSIQESQINHMNSSTWLPGKATWSQLTGVIKREDEKHIISTLIDYILSTKDSCSTTAELTMYTGLGEEKLETWKLGNVLVSKAKDTEAGYHFTLRYSNVEYVPTERSK